MAGRGPYMGQQCCPNTMPKFRHGNKSSPPKKSFVRCLYCGAALTGATRGPRTERGCNGDASQGAFCGWRPRSLPDPAARLAGCCNAGITIIGRKPSGPLCFETPDLQDEMGGSMNFASDNTAGVAPAVLDAIARANRGFALGYGG